MDEQRYEQALTDAFAHITTQPRPASTGLVADEVIARTVGVKPRRRVTGVRWLAAAAALLLAAGLLWSVLRPGPPIAGIPSPAPSPSTITGEVTAQLTFDIDESLPYAAAQIQVQRHNDTLTITASATKDGMAAKNLGSFTSPAVTTWSLAVDNDLQLALVPGSAEQVVSLSGGLVHTDYLGGVDMTAVAVEHESTNTAQELIWLSKDERVRDSLGAIIPSANLTAGNYPLTVFEDTNLNVWGFLDHNNDQRVTLPIDTEPVGALRPIARTDNGDYFEEASWVGMLPAGGTDPQLDTQEGVVWDSAPIGSTGRVALVVYADRGHEGPNRGPVHHLHRPGRPTPNLQTLTQHTDHLRSA